MVTRAVQAANVAHENAKFPTEAPGFTCDVDSLQSLWDAVHSQPGVPQDARLVIETTSPAGFKWWQRWKDVAGLPSKEADPIKVKVVIPRAARRATREAPAGAQGGKQGAAAGGGTPAGGRKQGKEKGAAAETPPTGEPESTTIAIEMGEEENYPLLRGHLDELSQAIKEQDAKLVSVEAAMIDNAADDKKVAVYARVQDRLSEHVKLVRRQKTALLLAMISAGEETDENNFPTFNYEHEEVQESVWVGGQDFGDEDD